MLLIALVSSDRPGVSLFFLFAGIRIHDFKTPQNDDNSFSSKLCCSKLVFIRRCCFCPAPRLSHITSPYCYTYILVCGIRAGWSHYFHLFPFTVTLSDIKFNSWLYHYSLACQEVYNQVYKRTS